MSDPQGAASDLLASLPRLQEVAAELRIPADQLRAHLRNQRIEAGNDDRLPRQVIFAALDREFAAGRAWKPAVLDRAK